MKTSPGNTPETNRTPLLAGAAAVLALAVGTFLLWPGTSQKGLAAADADKLAAPAKEPVHAGATSPAAAARPQDPSHSTPATPPRRSPEQIEALKAQIEDATVLYSEETLPQFRQWLKDPSQEIRKAAADGLMQSGLSGGAPLLREAALAVADHEEADEYRQGADVLDLPPATDEIAAALQANGAAGPPAHFNMKASGEKKEAGH